MTPPAATDLRPFIPARDFAQSQAFYAALGWDARVVGPGIALVTLGDAQHFYVQDYYVREFAENTMLHVTVDDAHAWHRHVAAVLERDDRFAGARVQPPRQQDYGALVTFVHDPSGVLLHLCQWQGAGT